MKTEGPSPKALRQSTQPCSPTRAVDRILQPANEQAEFPYFQRHPVRPRTADLKPKRSEPQRAPANGWD